MKKTTFVFDMGGVLLGHTMLDYINEYVNFDKERFDFFKRIVKSPTWIQMDAGLELNEAISIFSEETNHEKDEEIKQFIKDFRMKKDPNPTMEQLIRDIKEKGYKIYLMSNVSFMYKRFFPLIESISYMDAIWVSCERKLIKPNSEAFEDMFKLFSLNPQECFFIDDSETNIKAAKECGMDGFVYKQDVTPLREYIEKNIW